MRFLANENFPGAGVAALEASGHDVVWVRSVAPGMNDADVLAWGTREQRVLLTFDKDFGELASASVSPPSCGIVLFRIPMPPPNEVGRRLTELLGSRNDWAGHFSVVEPVRIRMRPLGRLRRASRART